MLRQDYLSVLEAKTRPDLRDRIIAFAENLGFERVGAVTIVERPLEEPMFASLNNTPVAYSDRANSPSRARRDPVARHCKRSSVPIVWSQSTYVEAGLGSEWEEQAPFGYANGIGVALHLPKGRHFLFGLDRSERLPGSAHEVTRLVAELQLFAVHACEAAERLVMPAMAGNDGPSLTPRELECLRWTMEGKTAWEVGNLLGISERTAVLHVNNATHKLDCVSKHQAVIKAMRLGLIH